MARVRQLPQLYLRGSLANITMKNLSLEQREQAERIYQEVVNDSTLIGDKNEFIHQLSVTIGGDYNSRSRLEAEQEFNIAVWRAVIHLLYHKSYDFICNHCGKTEYLTQRNVYTPINRCFPKCPACKCVKITDPGDAPIQPDIYISFAALQELTALYAHNPPKHTTPIKPCSGDDKVASGIDIVQDKSQLGKYFGEFIWNYFRQIIKENKITKRASHTPTTGCIDILAVDTIIAVLQQFNVKYYHERMPQNGRYTIFCSVHQTPPEVSTRYIQVLPELISKGASITFDDQAIYVKDMSGSGPVVDLTITNVKQVTTIGNGQTGDSCDDYMRIIEDREQSYSDIDLLDTVSHIKSQLPNELTKRVFDLICQTGADYEEYIKHHTHTAPRIIHMASILKCTPAQVRQCMVEIKSRTLACALI